MSNKVGVEHQPGKHTWNIPSLKLTASLSLKISPICPKRKGIIFQASIFKGNLLLVLGSRLPAFSKFERNSDHLGGINLFSMLEIYS